MNTNLTKYLSDVFRNEVEIDATPETHQHSQQAASHLRDQNTKQFVLDKRFSLRLDEMI